MKRVVLLLVLALLLTPLCLHAQDDDSPRYRLRVPTVDEYLQALSDSAMTINEEFVGAYSISTLGRLSASLFYLFPDPQSTSFERLLEVYTLTEIGEKDLVARGTWVQRMIQAWLYEHDVDLSGIRELRFEDFYITITPRDFNGDGINEYLLDASKGGRVNRAKEGCLDADVAQYLVFQTTADVYGLVESDLPWKGYPSSGRYSYSNGGMIELRFDDLNADGLPEWVILIGNETFGGPGMGYADGGSLLVLGWQNNRLDYLAPTVYAPDRQDGEVTTDFASTERLCDDGPFPATVEWDFTNIDGDAPLEILQAQYYFDNWSCKRTETRIFDWSPEADRYVYLETRIEYATHTQNCVQREAEEIMWTGDYAAAIPIFERSLTSETYDLTTGDIFNYGRSLNQYLRARLAFAYIMTDQGELADPLLETLAAEETEEETIAQFVETLIAARRQDFSDLQICTAVYNLFTANFLQIRVGYTGDDLYYSGNPYNPELIGCDAPDMLTKTLDSMQISVDLSPLAYLAELGIGTLRSLETDLNKDGQSEWLVWPDIVGVELFFAPGDDFYEVSYSSIDNFFQSTDLREIVRLDPAGFIATITPFLPGHALVPWYAAYGPVGIDEMQGPSACPLQDETASFVQALTLRQLQDGQLVPIFSEWQCGTSLDGIFEGNEASETLILNITECLDDYCSESVARPVSYSWDSVKQTYVLSSQQTQTPEPTAISNPQPTPTPRPYLQYYSVLNAFEKRDFTAVVGMTPQTFIIDPEHDLNDQLGDYYLRALALEALDRPNEALAEYVAIYEAAPESAWGRLAALHLERVEE